MKSIKNINSNNKLHHSCWGSWRNVGTSWCRWTATVRIVPVIACLWTSSTRLWSFHHAQYYLKRKEWTRQLQMKQKVDLH